MRAHSTRGKKILGAIASVAALSMVAAACGSSSGDDATKELTFVAFGGTTQEVLMDTIVNPFAEESGIDVKEDQPTDFAKIKAMVDAGKTTWDVVDADTPLVMQECGTLFEKLDMSKIDTSGIPDELKVSDCGLPNYRTGQVLYYNTEAYKDLPAPTSWDDFFDTDTYPGKRAVGSDPLYVLDWVMRSTVQSNADAYPIDYDTVFNKLDTIRDSLTTWSTGAEAVQMMESKQVNMIVTWPGRASVAFEDGAPFDPVWGASVFAYDVWAIPKGSEHVDEATEFINYAISAAPQTRFGEKIAYAPINTEATVPDDSTTVGKFAMSFEKQNEFDVLLRDQQWWADNWQTANDKFNAWNLG